MPSYADIASGRATTASPVLPTVSEVSESPSTLTIVSDTLATALAAVTTATETEFVSEPPFEVEGRRYPTLADLKDAVQRWAGQDGFAVFIRSHHRQRRTATLCCRLHGASRCNSNLERRPDTRKRQFRSMKSGCKFRIEARCHLDGSWTLEVAHHGHNHRRFPLGTFFEHRQLDSTASRRLRSLADESATPVHIHATLQREFPVYRAWLTRRRVADLVADHRGRRGCYNDVEAVLADMRANRHPEDIINVMVDTHGRACGVFFSTRDAQCLTRRFLSTFALDCTYKTNLYKLPLLEIVGTTATGRTFTSAVVLMVSESTAWYEKALETWRDFMGFDRDQFEPRTFFSDRDAALRAAMDTVFPDTKKLVCLWHIMRNILAGKHALSLAETREFTKDWVETVLKWTEDEYRAARVNLALKYRDGRFSGVRAVADHAIEQDGSQFILCYTKQCRTLGIKATSRAESKHASLKNRLQTSKGDIVALTNAVRDAMNAEWTEVTAALGKDMLDNCSRFPVMFEGLARNVSVHAMRLLEEQHRLLGSLGGNPGAMASCSGGFRATYGLPCWHELHRLREDEKPVDISIIDDHWHLDTAASMRARCSIDNSDIRPVPPPQRRETVVNGTAVVLDDGDDAIHLNNVYRPSRVISRGVLYSSRQLQVVATQLDGIPASGAGARPATGPGSRGGSGSTRREPTRADIVEAVAEAQEAAAATAATVAATASTPPAAGQRRRRPLCAVCNKRVRHRGICPKQRRQDARAAAAAARTAAEDAEEADTEPETDLETEEVTPTAATVAATAATAATAAETAIETESETEQCGAVSQAEMDLLLASIRF